MTEMKENGRKQTGKLKINNQFFPIYEGLNFIGRDSKAAIVVKNTIISKSHAAISVVDANTHLISDLNSSNGTRVRKIKLIPYKFYSINDNEPILFGDVVGMYFKHADLEACCIKGSIPFSQNVDQEASTQILTNLNNTVENIHELPTQSFVKDDKDLSGVNDSNEIASKNVSFNIHEAPTQIFGEPSIISNDEIKDEKQSLNIHEAPTQIFPDNVNIENKNQCVVNIHDAPTQYFETTTSIAPVQTVAQKEEKVSSKCSIENLSDDDTTQDLDTKSLEIKNSQNDLDVLSHTEVYDDIFANESFRCSLGKSPSKYDSVEVDDSVLVQSQFKKPENSELKSKNIDNLSDDDDIILSTQDSEIIDQKFREHQEQINASKNNLDEKIDEVSDSDATDVEDNLLIENVQNINCVDASIKATEVEINTKTEDKNEEIESTMIEKNVEIQQITENRISEDSDEEVDLLASVTSESINSSPKEDKKEIMEETDLASTQLIETNNEDLLLAPTQLLSTQSKPSSDDETDDELPATELLPMNVIMQNSKNSNKDMNGDDDDLFLAPTQFLITNSAKKKSSGNLGTTREKDPDDVYSAPTQKLTSDAEQNEIDVNNEDIYSAATQKLSVVENQEDKDLPEAATRLLSSEIIVLNERKSQNDSIFAAPTQMLSPKIPKAVEQSEKEVQSDEEVYEAATQMLSSENKSSNESKSQNKNVQKLNSPLKEPNDDIFMAPTQISTENSDNSKIQLSNDSTEASMHLHLSETEYLISQDSSFKDTENNPKIQQNTETQLEVSFELETQKLYIEERTRRPDNPLSHIFNEEATEMTEELDTESSASNVMDQTKEIIKKGIWGKGLDIDFKLVPIVSLVDIKRSKITLKDIQEASTSKLKKSAVKLERLKQEPARRSSRNKSENQNDKFTPDSEVIPEEVESLSSINAKMSLENDDNKDSDKEEKITNKKVQETSNKRKTKINGKLEITPKMKISTTVEETPQHSNTTLKSDECAINSKDKQDIEKEDKITNDLKVQETPNKRKTKLPLNGKLEKIPKTKILKKVEETPQHSNDSDFTVNTNSNRLHNTRGKRLDYKQLATDEFGNRGKITSKSFTSEKIDEMEIHIKEEKRKSHLKRNAAITPSVDASDSDDSIFTIKRSKRNTSKDKEPESVQINIRKKSNRESSQESVSKPKRTRNQKQKNTPKKNVDKINIIEINSDEIKKETHLGTRISRRRGKSNTNDVSDKIIIEDSDESVLDKNSVTTKEDLIIENNTRKRSSQIKNSPEKKQQNMNDICLNTPNSKRRKYEPLSVSTCSSQLINNEIEHKIVFTMLSDSNLENIVQNLGGSVVDSINICTVLVTNKISRSLKFLIAVALGKPIVHVKWIKDSEKRKIFLDPWDYLLEDTESEAKFKMSLKESLTTSKSKKLFSGETILLATVKNFEVLKEIIVTSGGKCITRAPPKNTKAVVVCYEDEKSKYSKYLKQKTLTVVSAEAIFSGVLQQKVNWNQYILS